MNFGQNLMSLGLLLFFLFVLMANVAIGYIIAILLGIGPPDLRTVWTRIKLSLANHLSPNESGTSHLSQVIVIIGLMTSFAGRFKKHAPTTSDEPELSAESPTTSSPTPKPSGNHPGKQEQSNTSL